MHDLISKYSYSKHDTNLSFQIVVTNSKDVQSNPSSVTITISSSSSPPPTSTPSSYAQNNGSTINSNINSFNNNGHNLFLNHQSQSISNYQKH